MISLPWLHHAEWLTIAPGEESMEKEMLPEEEREPVAQEIEFWDEDCGLADLAKDAFAALNKTRARESDKTKC